MYRDFMKIRYAAVETLIVIGSVICFLTFIHAASLVNNLVEYVNDISSYQYTVSYDVINEEVEYEDYEDGFSVSWAPEGMQDISFERIADILSELQFDTTLRANLQIGKTPETSYAYICIGDLQHAGRLEEEFAIDSEEDSSGIVYIGQSYLPYVYKKGNGCWIDIEGLAFAVVGVYQDDIISDKSDRVNIMYNSLTSEAKEKISVAINAQYNDVHATAISFNSDVINVKSFDAKELFETMNLRILNEVTADYTAVFAATYLSMSTTIMAVIYFFVFGNMAVICGFWVRVRYRELLVRKMHGASDMDVVRLYAKDFLRLCIYAVIVTIPVECIISNFWISARNSLKHIMVSFGVIAVSMGGILLTILLMAIFYYRRISLVEHLYE